MQQLTADSGGSNNNGNSFTITTVDSGSHLRSDDNKSSVNNILSSNITSHSNIIRTISNASFVLSSNRHNDSGTIIDGDATLSGNRYEVIRLGAGEVPRFIEAGGGVRISLSDSGGTTGRMCGNILDRVSTGSPLRLSVGDGGLSLDAASTYLVEKDSCDEEVGEEAEDEEECVQQAFPTDLSMRDKSS